LIVLSKNKTNNNELQQGERHEHSRTVRLQPGEDGDGGAGWKEGHGQGTRSACGRVGRLH